MAYLNIFSSYPCVRFLLLLLLCAAGGDVIAQPIGPSQPLTFKADSLITYVTAGGEVNELWGNVRIVQGVVNIEANRAVLYSATNNAVLTGNVRVTQPGMVLTAPRAEYEGNSRLAVAPAGMTLQEEGATLRAGSGTYNMYSRIAQFRNGVVLQDKSSTLRAASGDYFSVERRAVFTGGVQVDSDSGKITARDLTYWRDSRESFAVGNVVLISDAHAARLTGDTLRNRPVDGYTIATGSPRLVQIDTVASGDTARRDTTVITALKLEAFRSGREEYIATDSARLRRGDLEALAGVARFLMDDSIITLGPGAPRSAPDSVITGRPRDTSIAGRDTAGRDTSAGTVDDKLTPRARGATGPYPVVWYEKSQLTGDSITVWLQERKLRTIDVAGNAFAVTEGNKAQRYDQLAAVRLLFDVLRDTIRSVSAQGMASSMYFMYESDAPSGVNRASGDTINISFDQGEASRLAIVGKRARAEGEYFPEHMVAGMESVYRLEGFRWLGRDGSIVQLSGSLPKAPAIPEVKAPEGESSSTPSRIRTPR